MDDLAEKIFAVLGRLKSREALIGEDFALLIPVVENLASKLTSNNRINFKHVCGGYVIGNTLVKEFIGFKYIQYILQIGTVECLELTAGPLLPLGAASAEGREAAAVAITFYDDDNMEDIGDIAPNVSNAEGVFGRYDPLMDGKYIRDIRHRIDQLEASCENQPELEFLRSQLKKDTFHGRPHSHINEKRKAYYSVRKAIKKAISILIENPDTQHIGIHLKDHIKARNTCRYTGNWKFNF